MYIENFIQKVLRKNICDILIKTSETVCPCVFDWQILFSKNICNLFCNWISIIPSSNDGDSNRYYGDRLITSSSSPVNWAMPASLDLPTLLPEVPDRLHQQQLHYYFPAVHASVDPDSFSHKTLLQKALHFSFGHHPEYESTVESKSQKVKCFRFMFPFCPAILLCKSSKFNQSAFTTLKFQTKLFHSFF